MIGAIVGDIIGSRFEFDNYRSKDFKLFTKDSEFTDDTVMTVALADWCNLDRQKGESRLISHYVLWYNKYPNVTYGAGFMQWIEEIKNQPWTEWKQRNSYGNGSAMRISPIAWASSFDVENLKLGIRWATRYSHGHPEGLKGAEAVAMLIQKAFTDKNKNSLKDFIADNYGYDLNRTVAYLQENYKYNETCQKTVPEAIICFLESTDFEDAIRNAVSIGGDSDTVACITGSIAEAYYGSIPKNIIKETFKRLPNEMLEVILYFVIDNYPLNDYYDLLKENLQKPKMY